MPKSEATPEQFIALWRDLQSATKVAQSLGVTMRAVQMRRRDVERKYGIQLPVHDELRPQHSTYISESKAVATFTLNDGVILVGSDAHIWPGPLTTMQRAFLELARKLKPAAIVANGDFFDGAKVSKFASIGWESKPSVRQELDAVQDYMAALANAAPAARRFWPLGNHDQRFESRIANALPEMERVQGMHLKDHFPEWIPCWRLDVNDDVVIRHREKGGEHADYRNVVEAGKTIVTGHDHRANVTAFQNYRGCHWGVRCGYMAEASDDPQFVNYLEARAPNWQPAFAVLTFVGGRLLWPELCTKHDDGKVQFRGEVWVV